MHTEVGLTCTHIIWMPCQSTVASLLPEKILHTKVESLKSSQTTWQISEQAKHQDSIPWKWPIENMIMCSNCRRWCIIEMFWEVQKLLCSSSSMSALFRRLPLLANPRALEGPLTQQSETRKNSGKRVKLKGRKHKGSLIGHFSSKAS